MNNEKIGFIGIGNMGEALLRGVIDSSLFSPDSILASDINKEKLNFLSKELGINAIENNCELVRKSDIILFALKPDIINKVLSEVSSELRKPKWCISIAAGISISMIEEKLPEGLAIVRVMPNTPAMVREGMSAISLGRYANEEHLDKAKQIFQAVGKVIVVQEKYMDIVTALSGSGPAFIFLIIESLIDAGVQLGLSRSDASIMAVQTVLGSSKMLIDTQEHPAILKNKVTSPGGTTAVGLYELEKGGVRASIINAVSAAANRSKQISSEVK
ncbi:MAG: pyrroline-5-carboxylate reductase [bacterium]